MSGTSFSRVDIESPGTSEYHLTLITNDRPTIVVSFVRLVVHTLHRLVRLLLFTSRAKDILSWPV